MSTDTQPKVKIAPDVAQAMELANKARARRAKAPNTPVGQRSPIEQKNLMREAERTFKEKGLEVPHMLFIPRVQLKKYGYDGYTPILANVDSGDTFEVQGDIMVGCPEEQYQEYLKANSKKSRRIPEMAMKKAMENGRGIGGEATITTAKGNPDGTTVGPESDLLSGG